MKRFPCFRHALPVLFLFLFGASLTADVVTLKSGETKIGTIIAEDDSSVTLQLQLASPIKDSIKISKTEIKEFIRETPAQMEIREKQPDKILPSRDLMSVSDYDDIIRNNLRTFIAKYPGTPEAARIQGIVDTLEQEKARVSAGEVKVEGQWLDAATAREKKDEVEAYRLRLAMKTKMATGMQMPREIGALREFEKMRKAFSASLQYRKAIPEASEILDSYRKRLDQMALEVPIHKGQREKALKAATGADARALQAAIAKEDLAFKTVFDAQVNAGLKWCDVYKYDLKSIQIAQVAVVKERQELKTIKPSIP